MRNLPPALALNTDLHWSVQGERVQGAMKPSLQVLNLGLPVEVLIKDHRCSFLPEDLGRDLDSFEEY